MPAAVESHPMVPHVYQKDTRSTPHGRPGVAPGPGNWVPTAADVRRRFATGRVRGPGEGDRGIGLQRRGRARHRGDPADSQGETRGQRAGQPRRQLPGDLAEPLHGGGGREDFALAEFYRRVGEKEGVGETQALRQARAIAPGLQEAVTTGKMDDVRAQLKPEYEELFGRPGE